MRLKFDIKVNVEVRVEVSVGVNVDVDVGLCNSVGVDWATKKLKHAIFLPLRNILEFHVWES